jgi:lysophospholipase L1-like esterase
MNRMLSSALFASLLLLASNARAQEPERNSPSPRVFIVGDSHVFMLGPMLRERIEASGAHVLGYESRHGWSTERYRRAGDLRRVLTSRGRPDVVIVCLGGNDFVRSSERYSRDMRWVVDQAYAAGAQEVIWLGPATSNSPGRRRVAAVDARHAHNAQLQSEFLPTLHVRWIDSRPVTQRNHLRDGVHFTRTGYGDWTDGVFPELEDRLYAPPDPITKAIG